MAGEIKKNHEIFEVMSKRCNECLFEENRLVNQAAADEIIKKCIKTDGYFSCHKSTLKGKDVCCRGFYDENKNRTLVIRLARMLKKVVFVVLED